MERRPEFTVIAGPNGAGKSRLCPFYVSKKSFDGDKLALNIRKEHPDWPEHSDFGKIVALHIEKNGKHEVTNNPPLWFKEHFEKPFADLT